MLSFSPSSSLAWRAAFGVSGLAWIAASVSAWPWSSPLRVLLAFAAGLLGTVLLVVAARWPVLRLPSLAWPTWARIFFSLLGAVLLALVLLPPENTGPAYYYFVAFLPYLKAAVCAWLALSLAEFWQRQPRLVYLWQAKKAVLGGGAFLFAVLGLLLLAARALLGTSFEDFWYGAGVPLLTGQVLLAFLLGWAAWQAGEKLPSNTWLFVLIWLAAGLLWARQSVPPSFFITDKMLPNNEFYPYADALFFDWGSQFALIGQKLNGGVFYDRIFYMAWLTWLHSLFGQDYETLMAAQAAAFALFPALVFLIGAELHTPPAGLTLAAMLTFRELNNLAGSNWMATSNSKHMLTDFPTALGVALFTWLALRWLKEPQRWQWLAWAAGSIGFTSMIRPHVLFFLPFLLLLAWLQSPPRRWQAPGLAVLAFLASITPWAVFGAGTSPLGLYLRRFDAVWQTRYRVPPQQLPVLPGAAKPRAARQLLAAPEPPFVLRHAAHNLLGSAAALPLSPQILTLRQTLRGDWPFWQENWNGNFPPATLPWLGLGLALTALGSAAAAARAGARAWLPWAVFGLYMGANALARTSGGRYLVPADWLFLLYFGLGIAELPQLAAALLKQEALSAGDFRPAPKGAAEAWGWKPAFGAALILGLLGGLFPLTNTLYPQRFTRSPQQLRALAAGALGVDEQTLAAQPLLLTEARAFSPRWVKAGKYLPLYSEEIRRFDFDRTDFFALGPAGVLHVFVRQERPPSPLPNATDVIVVGCEAGDYVEALALLDGQGRLLMRSAAGEALTCP